MSTLISSAKNNGINFRRHTPKIATTDNKAHSAITLAETLASAKINEVGKQFTMVRKMIKAQTEDC